jgi:hypothetical protein
MNCYDLNTKDGMNNAVKWTQDMFDTVNDGGVWMVPRSMTMVRINKKDRIATIIVGFTPDPTIKRVIEAMGWVVVVE